MPNLHTSAEAWQTAGGSHHTVYSAAITAEILSDLAEMPGVELFFIDADTEMGRFHQQLRSSRAYYRPAPGF